MKFQITTLILAAGLAACSTDAGHGHDHDHDHGHDHSTDEGASEDHGEERALGTLEVAGGSYAVAVLGEVVPGKESAFEVDPLDGATSEGLYLWLEDTTGTQLSAPTKGEVEGDHLHYHATAKVGSDPARVVLRVRRGDVDERAGLDLD